MMKQSGILFNAGKKVILGTIATAMLATSGLAAEYVMKVSHVIAANTAKGRAADFLKKRIEELTGGKIEVQVFHNSMLYDDIEGMKALAMNNVQVLMPNFEKFPSIALKNPNPPSFISKIPVNKINPPASI